MQGDGFRQFLQDQKKISAILNGGLLTFIKELDEKLQRIIVEGGGCTDHRDLDEAIYQTITDPRFGWPAPGNDKDLGLNDIAFHTDLDEEIRRISNGLANYERIALPGGLPWYHIDDPCE